MNALEADVEAALGVPDAALASRLAAGASKTYLDGAYATSTQLNAKEPAIPAGTSAQYIRGDKTLATLDKTAVGLGNVDNTSDVGKPISSAVQAALDGKLGVAEAFSVGGSLEASFDADNVSAPVGTRLVIPTHVSPPGGQTTHTSALFFSEGWNGYKYWMAHTPYPGGNDDHEDPNIVASHDGITWVVPAGLTNPIDDADGTPEYNSDVDLKMGPNDTMYLFFRWYANTGNGGTEERLKYSTSTDGVTWSAPVTFMQNDHTVRRLVSPSYIFEDGAWTMYAVDILPATNTVVRLRSTNSSPESTWTAPSVISVGTMQAGKEAWHIFVLKYGGAYYGLLNDATTGTGGSAGDLLFIKSTDGLTFTNSGTTVIPRTHVLAGEHDNLYRSSMVPSYQDGQLGFRVFYVGWLTAGTVWNVYRTFLTAGAWKPLTLEGAWVNYTAGGGYRAGLWAKKVGRTVTVEGAVRTGAAGSIITTLPVGYAPVATNMYFVNAAGTAGMIQIFKDNTGTPADDRTVKYFVGATAPAYLPVSIKFEVS